MQSHPKPSYQRLLVIKHGAFGDIVQGFGAFASLRAGHPAAQIVLLTTLPFVELAKMMPWFDEVCLLSELLRRHGGGKAAGNWIMYIYIYI